MRIGIDARNLVPKLSGIGRYVIETSRHLAELGHDVLLYLPEPPSDAESIPPGVVQNVSQFNGALPRILWGNTRLPKLARQDQLDILWGPAHRLPILGSIAVPQVLTIHDLVWYHASGTMRFRGWLGERVFMGRSIRRADRIVSVSYATRSAVAALYPWAEDKIDVVYPGCTPLKSGMSAEILDSQNIDRPFVLFVGTLEPRKNLIGLLEAFAALPESVRAGLLLVIAGGQGWALGDLEAEITRLELSANVRLTGFVSDAELGALYQTAKFLAMPSHYEGFGLPIIEANAAGIPALTSNTSSMPEVGGEAALLVEPSSVQSIADGLERLATDVSLYSKLSSAARANAGRFDWRTSALALSRVFEETLGGRN
ncbi:glycosyltransferase family 1 protein [Rhizobium sp. BK176]|uniref:glycosyltransferase family 4 protein n=1 Tax=Rhizobium sp. BK176 TaxID=2587071 RepID=UPI00216750C0|nr:glycosyltransferase family 1 protein [Rhizobium sp. BK176]MCS4091841.1 glycosyltransferase involved in cell wall biosynthesis [Rhizobium sp. BK176]